MPKKRNLNPPQAQLRILPQAATALAKLPRLPTSFRLVIAAMRGLSFKNGLVAALKADTLSLTAWQIGMYGWMAIATFLIFRREIPKTSPVFWFMMQLAMWLGFATSYPVNWWLLRRRIKEAM